MIGVDELAQIIREVDGKNTLGAGSLSEAIVERLTARPSPDGGEVAGYVDSECVKQTQVNGGSVSIGSFSERYGRTTPVYWQPPQHEAMAALGRSVHELVKKARNEGWSNKYFGMRVANSALKATGVAP